MVLIKRGTRQTEFEIKAPKGAGSGRTHTQMIHTAMHEVIEEMKLYPGQTYRVVLKRPKGLNNPWKE